MKLKLYIRAVASICLLNTADAQINISELQVPTAPGFVLLDKSPAAIEKPATPKALAIDLLNIFTNNDGAIELSPYWLKTHRSYTFQKWIDTKSPVLQTLSLSAAGASKDSSSYMSAGLRTQVVRLYAEKKRQDIDAKYKEIQNALSVDPESAEGLNLGNLEKLRKELNVLQSQSTFSVEVAAALSGISRNKRFQDLGLNRVGAWITMKYQPPKTSASVLGLIRYTKAIDPWQGGTIADSAFLDYGLAVSYQKDAFDLQFEFVRRQDMEYDEGYNRTTLVANYQIMENLVVVASLGKNFSEVDNLIALFGVKFGLAKQRVD